MPALERRITRHLATYPANLCPIHCGGDHHPGVKVLGVLGCAFGGIRSLPRCLISGRILGGHLIVGDILERGRFVSHGDVGECNMSQQKDRRREQVLLHEPLLEVLTIPGALSIRRDATFPTAIVRDWTEGAQRDLERQISGSVEVEVLSLEEIFLELHR